MGRRRVGRRGFGEEERQGRRRGGEDQGRGGGGVGRESV